MKRLLWILIPLLLSSCIKDLEQEGIYNESTITGRVMEKNSQQPVAGIQVCLLCNTDAMDVTVSKRDGTFSLKLAAEHQSDNCFVAVFADSLYVGSMVQVPISGFGRKEYDLGVYGLSEIPKRQREIYEPQPVCLSWKYGLGL